MATINILDKKTYTHSETELLQPKNFLILWDTKCKKDHHKSGMKETGDSIW